jgi:branched-chain amino acid transport system permease protein
MTRNRQRMLGLIVSIIVVIALLQFFGWYFPQTYGATDTRLVAQAFYIGVAAMGLNILTGYNGQVSIGHGAFFGVGAYTTALLMDHQYTWNFLFFHVSFGHWPFLATLPASALVAFGVGALVGFPALRVKGLYLALVTLGLAVIFPDFVTRFVHGTGGTSLVSLPPNELVAPSWVPSGIVAPGNAGQDQWAYYNAFVFALLGILVVWVIARSRFGRSLIAVRDHEAAATSVGIDLARTKVLAFALSALYAGIAGSLSVLVVFQASADKVQTFQISIEFLVALVIGGTATVIGPVIGGFAVVYIQKWATTAFPSKPVLSPAIFGIALIVLMYTLPEGVVGGAKHLGRGFRRRVSKRRTTPAPSVVST